MASALAAGAASFLISYRNGLTWQQIRNALTTYSRPVSGAADMLDIFYALMGLDLMAGNNQVQKELTDVDDGTKDGNLRATVFTSDTPPDNQPDDIHTIPPGGTTTDHRRGDGYVTTRDFRAFRDAFLQIRQVEDASLNTRVLLDGALTHFKKDLNMDGCLRARPDACDPTNKPCVPAPRGHPHPNELCRRNRRPRGECLSQIRFQRGWENHANVVQPASSDVAPFKIDPDTNCTGWNTPAGCLRDIDVMTQVWDALPSSLPPESQPVLRQHFIENITADDTDPSGCSDSNLWQWQPRNGLLADRDEDGKIDYLYSTDLHFSGSELPADPSSAYVSLSVSSGKGESEGDELFFRHIRIPTGDWNSQRLLLTVPIYLIAYQPNLLGYIRVTAKGVQGGNRCWIYSGLRYGQDIAFPPSHPLHPNGGTFF